MARRWSAVLARLGTPTGDGRILSPGGITNRDLPMPLSWQEKSAPGHDGSIVIGRIETVSYGDGMITATGSMLTEFPQYYQVIEQIEAGVTGPSLDLADNVEFMMDDQDRVIITRGAFGGATLVPIEAFADVSITLDPLPAPPMEDSELWPAYADYNAKLLTFAADVTAARQAPVRPPADWFGDPKLPCLTPLTVSDPIGALGLRRVAGHVAGWETCHVGLPGCVTPPHSATDYALFHSGAQTVQEGGTLAVGTLVTGPRHADPKLTFQAAAQHYDDLSSAVAKVVAGEDEFGIWVAGWMLPDADPAKVEQFMSSGISGDWRRYGSSLELIAACSVNAPGFPVPRARAAFSGQTQTALVGAFSTGAPVRGELPVKVSRPQGVDEGVEARARWAWARVEG